MILKRKKRFEVLPAAEHSCELNSFVWKIEDSIAVLFVLKWDAFVEVNCSWSASRALQF